MPEPWQPVEKSVGGDSRNLVAGQQQPNRELKENSNHYLVNFISKVYLCQPAVCPLGSP